MEDQEPTNLADPCTPSHNDTVPLQNVVIGSTSSSSEYREFNDSPSCFAGQEVPFEENHSRSLEVGLTAEELLQFHNRTRNKAISRRIEDIKEELKPHREVLARLRSWHHWERTHQGSFMRFWPKLHRRPGSTELQSLVAFYFPPHELLSATICDFGEGRFERFKTSVSNVKLCKSIPPQTCLL